MKFDRLWKWLFVGIIITILFFLTRIVFFITEWLWYNTNGFSAVFKTLLWSQIICGVMVGVIFFAFIFINFLLVQRLKTRLPLFLGENVLQLPAHYNIDSFINMAGIIFAVIVSCLSGYDASTRWDLFLKWLKSMPFDVKDPVFLTDIGFYIFRLPLLEYLNSLAFFLVSLTLMLVVGLYFVERSVYYSPGEFFISKKPKAHLLSLVSILLLIKAWSYYLSMFHLLNSNKGIVSGALYTDLFAVLPYLKLAIVACIVCAIAILADSFSKNWRYSIISLIFLLILSLIGGVVYPGIMQKFIVAPNELSKEMQFISRNIEYTRMAFGLNNVEEREFPVRDDLAWKDIQKNIATIKNVRLWDHKPLLETYSELQEIRTYYTFFDVDNDRYNINGEYRQTMLSPRELSYDKLPDKKWINQTFIYTHGYGVCLGPVNKVTEDGLPEFFIKDIPPASSIDLKLERPEIYYGETPNSYCIVNTGMKEFDYPFGDKNMYCEYKGTGGVPIGSTLLKFLYALRFREMKIMLTSDIKSDSRIMFYRNINECIRKITPYVLYDPDPYLVISGGKLYWICDGYTISSNYPYSQSFPRLGNYMRNSVKAVIDAYNGNMRFFVSDSTDPIIQTYGRIFPGVFEPIENMPSDIRLHIRYPEGMFYAQALMYATYHMTDPQVFYNKEDLWKIPRRMEGKLEEDTGPYYTILRFPKPVGEKEEFILMEPFTPSRKANMIAWMAARCDTPNYGKILVYTFPKDKLIFGPSQIEARIDQDPEISKQLTLWGQGGSEVIRGSLLVIPIEDSLLYIQPLYLAAEKGKLPQLKRVIVVYGQTVAMETNLEEALKKVFVKSGSELSSIDKPAPSQTPAIPSVLTSKTENLKELIRKANEQYDTARKFQRDDNWAGYGDEMKKLRSTLQELKKAYESCAVKEKR